MDIIQGPGCSLGAGLPEGRVCVPGGEGPVALSVLCLTTICTDRPLARWSEGNLPHGHLLGDTVMLRRAGQGQGLVGLVYKYKPPRGKSLMSAAF